MCMKTGGGDVGNLTAPGRAVRQATSIDRPSGPQGYRSCSGVEASREVSWWCSRSPFELFDDEVHYVAQQVTLVSAVDCILIAPSLRTVF